MSGSLLPSFPARPRSSALALALLYLVAGLVWVAGGEWLLVGVLGQGDMVTLAQMTKGFSFVGVSAMALYFTLRWWSRHLDAVRARLNLVLRQIPGLLWTTDRRLGLQSMAGAAAYGLGDLRRAGTGLSVLELVEGDERRAVVEAAHRKALAGEPSDYEMDLRGGYFVVRVEPLRADGRITGCAAFALDVTGLRLPATSSGVREALERSQVLATVGSVVLEVGHQLMNPLFAMSSALDALEARVGDDPRTRRHRALLRDQVTRVTTLVSSLQEYGRLGDLELEPCDAGELLRDLERDWRRLADEIGAELVVVAPAVGELEISLDPALMGRALGQLVDNAFDHTPPGGQVRVRARRARSESSDLLITIEDEGRGFLAENLEQAKTPLTSRRPTGTGLGLAIAERVIQLHGGRLHLGNSAAGGALVSVTLHLAGAGRQAG